MSRLLEQLTIVAEGLARKALRSLPIDSDNPSLDDRVRLLEQRLRAVESRVMVRSVPRVTAPTKQELALLCLWGFATEGCSQFFCSERPAYLVEVQKAAAVDKAFRAAGGTYDELGNPVMPS